MKISLKQKLTKYTSQVHNSSRTWFIIIRLESIGLELETCASAVVYLSPVDLESKELVIKCVSETSIRYIPLKGLLLFVSKLNLSLFEISSSLCIFLLFKDLKAFRILDRGFDLTGLGSFWFVNLC